MRWRHVDWVAQRIRVRNAYVRGEHSGEGKSDESTRRSVPVADEAFDVLKVWQQRSAYRAPDDLVLCHPESGKQLDQPSEREVEMVDEAFSRRRAV